MTIEHPTPVVVMAGRHRAFWMVVRLIGVLIALLILPVLIVLNLLLYLVILPAAVQRSSASSRIPTVGCRGSCCGAATWTCEPRCRPRSGQQSRGYCRPTA